VVVLEWRGGAFDAEFSGSDEAAHLVTSLMIHDYVASGMPERPVKFAEDYYVRYPKVAFGIWPPLFHLTQAAGMLAFGPSRTSILLLTTLWAAILSWLCFIAAHPRFPFVIAAGLGAVLISLPEVQQAAGTVMADLMVACFIFAAAIFYGRYLDRENWADAVAFGVCSAIAMLVKYNALALVLVPPFTLMLTGRVRAIRRASFWVPVLVVVVLCEPWYFYSRHLVRYAMDPVPGIADIPGAMVANSRALVSMIGIPLFLLALVGMFVKLRRSANAPGIWAASAALIAALWFFHSILYPISEGRYLLAAAPALLLFAAAGCQEIALWAARRFRLADPPVAAVFSAALALYLVFGFHVEQKKRYGVSEIAAALSQQENDANGMVLVSGSAETEGMLISEMALRDRHQNHCVLRASKVLAHSTWMGEQYELLYHNADEVARFLRELPITTVVLDLSKEYNRPHQRLLEEALCADSALWARVPSAQAGSVRVYQRTAPVVSAKQGTVSIDLTRTLGRSLPAPIKTSSGLE
jgi:hypothetical protein